MPRVLILIVLLTIVISLLCIWFYPTISDYMTANKTWNGLRKFSREVAAEPLGSVESLSGLTEEPEEKALIIIPVFEYKEKELTIIKKFVTKGGILLLMDDYGYGNSILSYLGMGVRFSGVALLDQTFSYKNLRLPRIVNFSPEVQRSGISVLLLNHATALVGVQQEEVLAWSSQTSFLDNDESGNLNRGDITGPFSVASVSKLGQGKIFLVSDPSIIINSMVGKDNNYDFIKYLLSYESGNRKTFIDVSHLSRLPLDVSKSGLFTIREVMANTFVLLGMLAAIFISTYRFAIGQGDLFDRKA